jgi:hypothetical protein
MHSSLLPVLPTASLDQVEHRLTLQLIRPRQQHKGTKPEQHAISFMTEPTTPQTAAKA